MFGLEKRSLGASFPKLELLWDYPDRAPVFVLFILVWSLLFRDGTSCTEGNKEQVLATMVPTMVIRRLVCTPLGPVAPPPVTPSQLRNSVFDPLFTKSVSNPRRGSSGHR
jgi:hypothetical protein